MLKTIFSLNRFDRLKVDQAISKRHWLLQWYWRFISAFGLFFGYFLGIVPAIATLILVSSLLTIPYCLVNGIFACFALFSSQKVNRLGIHDIVKPACSIASTALTCFGFFGFILGSVVGFIMASLTGPLTGWGYLMFSKKYSPENLTQENESINDETLAGAPAEQSVKTQNSQQVAVNSDKKGCESSGDKLGDNQVINIPAGAPETLASRYQDFEACVKLLNEKIEQENGLGKLTSLFPLITSGVLSRFVALSQDTGLLTQHPHLRLTFIQILETVNTVERGFSYVKGLNYNRLCHDYAKEFFDYDEPLLNLLQEIYPSKGMYNVFWRISHKGNATFAHHFMRDHQTSHATQLLRFLTDERVYEIFKHAHQSAKIMGPTGAINYYVKNLIASDYPDYFKERLLLLINHIDFTAPVPSIKGNSSIFPFHETMIYPPTENLFRNGLFHAIKRGALPIEEVNPFLHKPYILFIDSELLFHLVGTYLTSPDVQDKKFSDFYLHFTSSHVSNKLTRSHAFELWQKVLPCYLNHAIVMSEDNHIVLFNELFFLVNYPYFYFFWDNLSTEDKYGIRSAGNVVGENEQTEISQQVSGNSDKKGYESAEDKFENNQAVNTSAGAPTRTDSLDAFSHAFSTMCHLMEHFSNKNFAEGTKQLNVRVQAYYVQSRIHPCFYIDGRCDAFRNRLNDVFLSGIDSGSRLNQPVLKRWSDTPASMLGMYSSAQVTGANTPKVAGTFDSKAKTTGHTPTTSLATVDLCGESLYRLHALKHLCFLEQYSDVYDVDFFINDAMLLEILAFDTTLQPQHERSFSSEAIAAFLNDFRISGFYSLPTVFLLYCLYVPDVLEPPEEYIQRWDFNRAWKSFRDLFSIRVFEQPKIEKFLCFMGNFFFQVPAGNYKNKAVRVIAQMPCMQSYALTQYADPLFWYDLAVEKGDVNRWLGLERLGDWYDYKSRTDTKPCKVNIEQSLMHYQSAFNALPAAGHPKETRLAQKIADIYLSFWSILSIPIKRAHESACGWLQRAADKSDFLAILQFLSQLYDSQAYVGQRTSVFIRYYVKLACNLEPTPVNHPETLARLQALSVHFITHIDPFLSALREARADDFPEAESLRRKLECCAMVVMKEVEHEQNKNTRNQTHIQASLSTAPQPTTAENGFDFFSREVKLQYATELANINAVDPKARRLAAAKAYEIDKPKNY